MVFRLQARLYLEEEFIFQGKDFDLSDVDKDISFVENGAFWRAGEECLSENSKDMKWRSVLKPLPSPHRKSPQPRPFPTNNRELSSSKQIL